MKNDTVRKRRAVAAMLASLLMFGGVVAMPQVQTAAHAAVIQGWCNTSSVFDVGTTAVQVPTLGAQGTRACQMSQGSYSNGVKAMQSALWKCHGYDLARDGDWGPATSSAVRDFQRTRGLTADAVYGPQTHNAMRWFDYAPLYNLRNCVADVYI